MKKYFLLQLKRGSRFLIWGLCVVLVLFGCMTMVYNAMVTAENEETEAETQKIKIGVAGTTQHKYLQWGLAAMKLDSTAMSLQLVGMEESEAMDALLRGEIMAYFVFPDNFVDDAMYGDVHKLRFVSRMGATGLISIVKNEIISLADSILIACESGSYGVGDAVDDNGSPETYGKHVNDLSIEYVDFLLDRSKMYNVESTAQNNASIDQYMLSGLTVTMLMLSCLPFAPLYIRADQSLFRVLRARRVGPVRQTVAEFAAYLLVMMVLLAAVSAVLHFGGMMPEETSLLGVFAGALPTLTMMAALSYCMYTFSDHIISGVLLSFFVILALCFVGGCMYPIYFFPLSVQSLAAVLPTGIAWQSMLDCFTGASVTGTGALLAYSAAFLAIAVGVRAYRAGKSRG